MSNTATDWVSHERALKNANALWAGVYGVVRHPDSPTRWLVTLHSASGPQHVVTDGGAPACACCASYISAAAKGGGFWIEFEGVRYEHLTFKQWHLLWELANRTLGWRAVGWDIHY